MLYTSTFTYGSAQRRGGPLSLQQPACSPCCWGTSPLLLAAALQSPAGKRGFGAGLTGLPRAASWMPLSPPRPPGALLVSRGGGCGTGRCRSQGLALPYLPSGWRPLPTALRQRLSRPHSRHPASLRTWSACLEASRRPLSVSVVLVGLTPGSGRGRLTRAWGTTVDRAQ